MYMTGVISRAVTTEDKEVYRIKTLSLFQGHPQNHDQILTLQIVLHDRQNNFYALVMPS